MVCMCTFHGEQGEVFSYIVHTRGPAEGSAEGSAALSMENADQKHLSTVTSQLELATFMSSIPLFLL